MLQKILVSLILIFTFSISHAEWQDWSTTDRSLFVASQLAITADWATTRYGARHQIINTWETNPVLGKYPSTAIVDLYFIGLLVSNYYIADWVDDDYRGLYLSFRTITHGYAASHNTQNPVVGWRMRF
jgi:hypothetical protein